MNKKFEISLLILRLGIGWLYFYAGISKILNPDWTAAGYLNNATTFNGLFSWFALPQNIGWVNFLNEWGLTLIGFTLILGAFIRYASFFGGLITLLYYFPILDFPNVGQGFIVDKHVLYILIFAVLCAAEAGKHWGLDKYLMRRNES